MVNFAAELVFCGFKGCRLGHCLAMTLGIAGTGIGNFL